VFRYPTFVRVFRNDSALLRTLGARLAQNLSSGGWPGFQNRGESLEVEPAEAAQAFDEIKRITNERLRQALRIQQALERGAPEEEVQAERRKYLEALDGWNAALKPPLAFLTDAEP
jgi:hypothetical protein